MKLDKLDGNVDSLSNRIANRLGHMFQIKIIGLKIRNIGLKKKTKRITG